MERVQRGEEPWDCRHVDSCGEGERQVAKAFVCRYLSWGLSLAESSTAPFTARQARATQQDPLFGSASMAVRLACLCGERTQLSRRKPALSICVATPGGILNLHRNWNPLGQVRCFGM